MKTRITFVAGLTAGIAALGIAAFALSGSETETATAAAGSDPAATQALSPRFAAGQTAADVLPGFLLEGSQQLPGVLPATTRILGSKDGANYWLAKNDNGEACLISLMPGADELASMTCLPASKVWKQGLALQVQIPGKATRSYFLPAGYQAEIAGFQAVNDQLMVGDAVGEGKPISATPKSSSNSRSAATTYGSGTVELPALPAPDLSRQGQ